MTQQGRAPYQKRHYNRRQNQQYRNPDNRSITERRKPSKGAGLLIYLCISVLFINGWTYARYSAINMEISSNIAYVIPGLEKLIFATFATGTSTWLSHISNIQSPIFDAIAFCTMPGPGFVLISLFALLSRHYKKGVFIGFSGVLLFFMGQNAIRFLLFLSL